MDREDRDIFNSERDASSQMRGFNYSIDPHDTSRNRYSNHLRPDQRDALHRSMTSESTATYSNAESIEEPVEELEEVETAEVPPGPREYRSSEPLSEQNTVELQEIGTPHVSRRYSQAPVGRIPTGVSPVSGIRRGSVMPMPHEMGRTDTNESTGYGTGTGYNNRYSWMSRSPTNVSVPNRRFSRALSRTETVNTLEHSLDALDRIETQRIQQYTTIGKAEDAKPINWDELPGFGAGKPYPPDLPDREEYVVEFDGPDDPLHGQNWPNLRKWIIVAMLSFDSLSATIGSAIFSPGIDRMSSEYHSNPEVGTVGTSLFIMGFAFGPIIWAPLSELYGRRLPLVISAFGFAVFTIGVATGENLQTIILCRFFSGIFGSCPLACVAAVFADIFNNKIRGLAIAIFASMVFLGPFLSSFMGGFLTTSTLGWRWSMYISAIVGFIAFGILFFFLPETYPPAILAGKAAELRRATLNWGIHSKQEEVEVDIKELLTKNISRPIRLLFTEPIILAVTIYMSFVYGLLYGFLTAYAKVFQGKYHMTPGVGGLPYFGMVIGEFAAMLTIVYMNRSYVKKLEKNNNIPVPEWRLPIVIVAGFMFSGGLFWFGWSGYTGHTHWIVPTLSGLFTGFGIYSIFLQLMNYIVDAYLMFAASALAANTFMRSLVAAAFPLFSGYMMDNMGIEWALTLLGLLSLIMIPMPVIFLMYGKKIRARSKFAPSPDIEQDKYMRDEETRGSMSEKTL